MIPKEALRIDGVHFKDRNGRIVLLRGLNVGGNTKQPADPDIPSHINEGFLDGDQVSFVGRPFPLQEADQHLARLKGYGYNVIRFIITWEAIEHAGPDKYDDEYVDYVVKILQKCRDHKLYVFIDPHQDVWSRFSGGSGAPLWTLYACGFDPETFTTTEAALTHNFYSDPENYPKMVWSTNYHRLVSYTMFTLFFAGREYAPNAIINNVNIQDFLEDHYLGALKYLAQRIHDAGNLEDSTVIGWESMNEPSVGFVGYTDLKIVMKTQQLRKTTCPSGFQSMLLGQGIPTKVDIYEWTKIGPMKMGSTLVDPGGQKAWLSVDYNDKRYGFRRDPGWKLGECIWAQHGVWDTKTREILRPDYFNWNRRGETIDNDIWLRDHFMVHFRRYTETIRSVHKHAIMFLQPPVMFVPPILDRAQRIERLVFSPHYYDGLTLMLKKWNWWNIDALGYLRGKYINPLSALRFGYTAIRNSLRDQLIATKQEGLENIGETPCLMSEIGIPYDMDNKKAYLDGKYTHQYAAMDANNYALEGAGISFTLWTYCPQNNHKWGDFWNGEDLSVWSPANIHHKPPTFTKLQSETTSDDINQPLLSNSIYTLHTKNYTPDNPETSFSFPYNASLNAGSRAFEAFVRPAPVVIAGIPRQYGFDMKSCTFSLTISPFEEIPPEDAPTEIFIPTYLFQDYEIEINVSSGRWVMNRSCQVLRWWHFGLGEQSLIVSSAYTKEDVIGMVGWTEGWYYTAMGAFV